MTDPSFSGDLWNGSLHGAPQYARLKEALSIYREGRCGLPFSSLSHFALPLIQHYDLHVAPLLHEEISDSNWEDMEILVDVLESTHLLICYMTLKPEQQNTSYSILRDSLLGPTPEQEEEKNFNSCYKRSKPLGRTGR